MTSPASPSDRADFAFFTHLLALSDPKYCSKAFSCFVPSASGIDNPSAGQLYLLALAPQSFVFLAM